MRLRRDQTTGKRIARLQKIQSHRSRHRRADLQTLRPTNFQTGSDRRYRKSPPTPLTRQNHTKNTPDLILPSSAELTRKAATDQLRPFFMESAFYRVWKVDFRETIGKEHFPEVHCGYHSRRDEIKWSKDSISIKISLTLAVSRRTIVTTLRTAYSNDKLFFDFNFVS